MIFTIQIILIIVLFLILIALYLDEQQKKKARLPNGKLVQYWGGIERRRFVRINTNVPIKYRLSKKPDNHSAVNTKDISGGGICITINEKLSPKTRLSLEVTVPGSTDPLITEGEVVWVKEVSQTNDPSGIRQFNTGIEFKALPPKDSARLLKFVGEFIKDKSGKD